MGDFLAKLIPKFPDFAFEYWDCFLGLCFVVAPLLHGDQLTKNSVFLPPGFGLIFLSMARRNWRYVGMVRLLESGFDDVPLGHKVRLAYPKVIMGSFWFGAFVVCLHYSARNLGITAPWVRWLLRY
jgi:hypothetical protein